LNGVEENKIMIEYFFVDKTTGTPADTLAAFGFAALLEFVVPESAGDPGLRIEDEGDCYRISLAIPFSSAWLEEIEFFSLLQALDTAKQKSNLPNTVDYVAHQSRNNAYFEGRKKGLDPTLLAEQGLIPPHADWPAWAIINQMAATNTYNGLVATWHLHRPYFATLIQMTMETFRQRPNDIAQAEQAWTEKAKQWNLGAKSAAAQLQVVNPGMGKGGNKSKANGLSIGGLNGFWLIEYLKFAGLLYAAVPRTVSGSKDRKTYVLRPKSLLWRTHRTIFPKFQNALYAQTAIKMDILASLRYCRTFLQQWKEGQGETLFIHAEGSPGDHVAGLEVIHYKHLGSAHATMNLSTLILPNWLPQINSIEQANLFLSLLSEHETIVRNLEEKISREFELLRSYRDFLSGKDLSTFFQFTGQYASYVLNAMLESRFPPRRFHTTNLEVLIMSHNPDLAAIVQNPGFRRIARAIRTSTVVPQWYKAQARKTGQPNPNPYDIRYGLGADLLRHASYPEKFAQALATFIYEYSQENARVNARVNERTQDDKPVRRHNIREQDIEDVLSLISQFQDSETVANLLVAFGYASDPRQNNEGGTSDPPGDSEELFSDSDDDSLDGEE